LPRNVVFLHAGDLKRTVKGTVRRHQAAAMLQDETAMRCLPTLQKLDLDTHAHTPTQSTTLDQDGVEVAVNGICSRSLPRLQSHASASLLSAGLDSVSATTIAYELCAHFELDHFRADQVIEATTVRNLAVEVLREMQKRSKPVSVEEARDRVGNIASTQELLINRPRRDGTQAFTQHNTYNAGGIQWVHNSLGWRSDEHNPELAYQIFIVGNSHFIGAENELRDHFAYSLAQRIAARDRMTSDQIGVLNFSIGGAAPAFVLRSVITQCSRVRPNLVIFQVNAECDSSGDYPFDTMQREQYTPWIQFARAVPCCIPCAFAKMASVIGAGESLQLEYGRTVALPVYLALQSFLNEAEIAFIGFIQHQASSMSAFLQANEPLSQRIDMDCLMEEAVMDFAAADEPQHKIHLGPHGNQALAATLWNKKQHIIPRVGVM